MLVLNTSDLDLVMIQQIQFNTSKVKNSPSIKRIFNLNLE